MIDRDRKKREQQNSFAKDFDVVFQSTAILLTMWSSLHYEGLGAITEAPIEASPMCQWRVALRASHAVYAEAQEELWLTEMDCDMPVAYRIERLRAIDRLLTEPLQAATDMDGP